jgi:hypothetical protein
MRPANQADYLTHASDIGWLVDDAAWLMAGIEPTSIPPSDRDIPVEPHETFSKERMWERNDTKQIPALRHDLSPHLQDLVDIATSIKRLILADKQSGKLLPEYPEGYESTPRALPPREWVRWAKSRGINVPQELLDAVKEETPKEFDMRLAQLHWDLGAKHRDPTKRLMELIRSEGLTWGKTTMMNHVRNGRKLRQIANATKNTPVAK